MKETRLIVLADLGYGVLDTAMVEMVAYVLKNWWSKFLAEISRLGIDK